MRLRILDGGQSLGTKALFMVVAALSRQPVPDVVKLHLYRPEFYGKAMMALVHQAMRGASTWPVADRELMAAFVSKVNACEF